jgi:hypothetical protein
MFLLLVESEFKRKKNKEKIKIEKNSETGVRSVKIITSVSTVTVSSSTVVSVTCGCSTTGVEISSTVYNKQISVLVRLNTKTHEMF